MNSLDKLRNSSSLKRNVGVNNEIVAANNTTKLMNSINSKANIVAKERPSTLSAGVIEIVCVIDASGSCSGLESATVRGFNNLITTEMTKSKRTLVTVSLIKDVPNIYMFRENIINLPNFSYEARGNTALYDTLCKTILDIRKSREITGLSSEKTIVAIMTDGVDNNSRKYDINYARNLIRLCMNEGWQFVFLGAFTNSKKVAESLGIVHNVETSNTASIMEKSFNAIENAIEDLRKSNAISSSWADEVDNHVLGIEQKRTRK